MAKIGLWSDCHHFPSLPLMKLSAYHKSIGDQTELFDFWNPYDLVYSSKVFSFTEDIDTYPVRAEEIRRGGTGYCISDKDGREVFDSTLNISLPPEIEHIYPDYNLYPDFSFSIGFLTRGCPRNCGFCIVGTKEGLCSQQVADLSEFWHGQKEIKLLDANILACQNHELLLRRLADSKARIDFTQGLDIRLVNRDNIELLNHIKTPTLHFAWDNPQQDLTEHFRRFSKYSTMKNARNRIVYVLVNYDSTIEEDLYRIYTLRELGYSPYVMIYQKEQAPKIKRQLQRWVNC